MAVDPNIGVVQLDQGDPHRVPSATPPSCRLPVNAEVLSKAMSSIIDKRKSVAYAPLL
jgi:hypothetical protein